MPASSRRTAALAFVLALSLPAAACSSGGGTGTTAAAGSTAAVVSASAATSAAASSTPSGAASPTSSVDACSLLTTAAAKSIGVTLGTGRAVSSGDLTECAYDDAGPLIVAVLDSRFTLDSFKSLISSQDNGPYASTTGKSAQVSGLGDAAYSYAKTGIVEVLKGSTVISITAADLATAEEVAKAVLPNVG